MNNNVIPDLIRNLYNFYLMTRIRYDLIDSRLCQMQDCNLAFAGMTRKGILILRLGGLNNNKFEIKNQKSKRINRNKVEMK
mgnify:CR=1 FL=1